MKKEDGGPSAEPNEDPNISAFANPDDVSSDDDVEWYRKEVGEEPDADLFRKNKKKQVRVRTHPPKEGAAGASRTEGGSKPGKRDGQKGSGSGKASSKKREGGGDGGKPSKRKKTK